MTCELDWIDMMEGDIFRIVTMRCSDYCPDYLFVLAAAALKNCSRLEWIGMMQCNKLKRYFLIDPSCCTFSTSNFWWYLAWPGLVLVPTSTGTIPDQYQYPVPVHFNMYRYQPVPVRSTSTRYCGCNQVSIPKVYIHIIS